MAGMITRCTRTPGPPSIEHQFDSGSTPQPSDVQDLNDTAPENASPTTTTGPVNYIDDTPLRGSR